jgi:hypothetical protein
MSSTNQVPIKDNKLILRIKDGQVRCNTEVPMPFEDLLSVFCTVMLGAMRDLVASVPADKRAEATGSIYDAFNVMVSKTLERFAPEYELRPGLTAKAILEAENKIITEHRLNEVEPHS